MKKEIKIAKSYKGSKNVYFLFIEGCKREKFFSFRNYCTAKYSRKGISGLYSREEKALLRRVLGVEGLQGQRD